MPRSIPRTASPGRSQSPDDRRARGLGLFSVALGVTELLAPRAVCAAVGLDGHEGLVRAYGAREIATGAAILASHDATPWMWGRVLGDAADLVTVAMGLGQGKPKKDNAVLALTVGRRHCGGSAYAQRTFLLRKAAAEPRWQTTATAPGTPAAFQMPEALRGTSGFQAI